jgi:hypothetical protein
MLHGFDLGGVQLALERVPKDEQVDETLGAAGSLARLSGHRISERINRH